MNYAKYYPWLTTAIVVAVILAIAYYFGNRSGKAKSENKQDDTLKKEIESNELSYEQTQYSSMADKIETALYGFTNDEQAVYSVFSKMRTRSDVLNLIRIFGNRRIIWTFGNSNLNQWINVRLETSEIAQINDILSRNGINYQF